MYDSVKYDYDILIIGGGPAGYVAASYSAQFGRRTALIEKDRLGGCCLNTGCIPTKTLLEAARRYSELRSDETFGITCGGAEFAWEKLKKRSEAVRTELRGGVARLMSSRNVSVISGTAALEDAHTVVVGERRITSEYIIIAVGSRPSVPERYLGIDGVTDTDSFWELETLPDPIVIVGGGVTGCEIASALSRLGSRVSVIEQTGSLLPMFDARASGMLMTQLTADGAGIYLDSTVEDIIPSASGFAVKTGDREINCEKVLWAAGRVPAPIDAGTLELARTERGFISVDGNYRTSVDSVFCVGDANGLSLLAYSATAQAMKAVKYVCAGIECGAEPVVPLCVFTCPAIASIGLSESECREEKLNTAVGYAPYSALGCSYVAGGMRGYVKILRDIDRDIIVGAEIAGTEAIELIHTIQPFVARKLPVRMLADIIPAHPTFCEGIKLAVEDSYTGSPQL